MWCKNTSVASFCHFRPIIFYSCLIVQPEHFTNAQILTKINAIYVVLTTIMTWVSRKWPYVCLNAFSSFFWNFVWARSSFWGVLRMCLFWWKSIKKCDRESACRRTDTDRLTHWQTQTDFIICPMLYAIAMGQIKTLKNKAGQYTSKT